MRKLKDILPEKYVTGVYGDTGIAVRGLALDSRKVEKDFLFAALPGITDDGSKYISPAINNGSNCIITSGLPGAQQPNITYIVSDEPAKLLALIAAAYYGNPTSKMELVGVTGTNGKTTIATLLYNLFRGLGYRCGLVSTIAIKIEDNIIDTQHTTPDTITLNALFAEMVAQDCDFVFMEVSSHAIAQDRVFGLEFRGGIFTNITHDHLDYHKTFENYRNVKKAFFDGLDSEAFAITNIDDRNGNFMLQNTKAVRVTYALKTMANFKGKIIEYDLHGMQMQIDGDEIFTKLTGTFNAYNILAVYTTAIMLDITKEKILPVLSGLNPVEGRFTQIHGHDDITGIVDYAHTPDALQNILKSIKEISIAGRIITVVGCGGNRDTAKRPEMAKIAAELSDRLILTSDNPRNEKPEDILIEMEQGIPLVKRKNTLIIPDRKEAIKTACALAQKGDIILVAGKGHEKYQEIAGVKYPFDDKEVLTMLLNEQAA